MGRSLRCAGLQPAVRGVAACGARGCSLRSMGLHRVASVQQRLWLVWPLDAHDAVEQFALEGVGKLQLRARAALAAKLGHDGDMSLRNHSPYRTSEQTLLQHPGGTTDEARTDDR